MITRKKKERKKSKQNSYPDLKAIDRMTTSNFNDNNGNIDDDDEDCNPFKFVQIYPIKNSKT